MKQLITNISIFIFVVFASVSVLPPSTVSAAKQCPGQTFFLPRWYDNMCDDKGNIASPAPKNGKKYTDTANSLGSWILTIVMNVVKILLVIVGYVALIGIIWGGFKYMTQGDSSSGTAAARKTIQNAVIGLIISIMSVAIINLVTGAIG